MKGLSAVVVTLAVAAALASCGEKERSSQQADKSPSKVGDHTAAMAKPLTAENQQRSEQVLMQPQGDQELPDFNVRSVDPSGKYAEYVNARFLYAIRFPAKMLIPQGEATNGDGQTFLSQDKTSRLIVYGANNAFDRTLKSEFEEELNSDAQHQQSRQITMKIFRGAWFVISGQDNGVIFYKKRFLVRDHFIGFEITYPIEQRGTWDKIVAELSESFKADISEPSNERNSIKQVTPELPTTYLPWTLEVVGYGSGKCEVTELARSFKEARGWASESSGWINVHSIIESPKKITITYYDGLLKSESIRTFYKDMKTCKAFRQ